MLRWIFLFLSFLTLALGATGCSRSDPEAALNQSAKAFIAAIENKDVGAAMELLDENFTAQTPDENRDWAKRTMALAFFTHRKIGVTVLRLDNRIDAAIPARAFSDGDVLLTGAENILPDNASRFHVEAEWKLDGGEWKLVSLKWE